MAKHLWQSTLFVFAVGLIALVVANAPLIRAQVITSGKPRLESASVRPCRTGERGNRSAPGLLNFQCVDLVNFNGFGMIQWAYGLDANIPVTGGPSWLASDLWDITAKAADNTSDWTMEGPMLQAVLEDRFKLR